MASDQASHNHAFEQEIARRILLAYRFTPEELGVPFRLSWPDRVRIRINRKLDRIRAVRMVGSVADGFVSGVRYLGVRFGPVALSLLVLAALVWLVAR